EGGTIRQVADEHRFQCPLRAVAPARRRNSSSRFVALVHDFPIYDKHETDGLSMGCRKRVEKEYLVLTSYCAFSGENQPERPDSMWKTGQQHCMPRWPGAMLRDDHEMEPKLCAIPIANRSRGACTLSNR